MAAGPSTDVDVAEFAGLHPYAPMEDAAGMLELIGQLERWLVEITGYAAVSLQPNAGSQGELAGLLAITSPDRLHRDWRESLAHSGTSTALRLLARLRPGAALVTVTDSHPATLSWLGSVARSTIVPEPTACVHAPS